ncbi:MAG: sulfatase-like hydrolase/transferase [Lentisphaerae bacterium]|jgi:arylsulfatase A-like enzyme|nr:sulfatase-like hydrolase/transferase [Lentisphaerota bacterium]MBT4819698.1 sulfatase-like hydrolase/transferase [Lentisphaerota bacterium]MBT5605637.1 sulfatase-like hydrolase/transferase [Lentisphaerota bacterium]MBT7054441.1 sulfatase-like hydrolase/transferase [Lentisphaerota bacterium]MBT7842679.1 sulfatase-like hydrolase/transferase [Lentisphaerota bacterium]
MRIDRREFMKRMGMTAAMAAGLRSESAPNEANPRLNILYIMTDQQPVSCVGSYTDSPLQTPHLDDLAGAGCVLDRLYIGAFPCSPSRACQLTGRYAHNHGVVTNDVLLDPALPTLGTVCRSAGYATGYFGKWHLGGNMYVTDTPSKRAGGLSGNWHYERLSTPRGWTFRPAAGGQGEDAPQAGFDTWRGGWRDYHEWLRRIGQGAYLGKHKRLGNHNDAPSGPEGTHIYSQVDQKHHMAAFFTEETVQFVREKGSAEQPWCAVLSYYGPHLPVAPPKPWDTMYSLEQVRLPANHSDPLDGKPLRQRNGRRNYKLGTWSDEQYLDYIRRYWGYCSYLDEQIGRVFAALRETGQWDTTIIVFTADHGDMVGAHGMIFKLGFCGYEELFRVPGILRIPGVTRAGSRAPWLVNSVDLLPTLLASADVPVPPGVDGQSLLPALRGDRSEHRDVVFSDSLGKSIVCRNSRFKFVLNWAVQDLHELYDLQTDPGELRNLATVKEHQGTVRALKEAIYGWLRSTGHTYAEEIVDRVEHPDAHRIAIVPTVDHFTYLGENVFEWSVTWRVDREFKAEGAFWNYTHFVNKQYAKDGDIAFRCTPFPAVPFTHWQAGKQYRVGPVRVAIPAGAGAGDYAVRTGLYDPKKRKGPGDILNGQGSAVMLGTLTVRAADGRVTGVAYRPPDKKAGR